MTSVGAIDVVPPEVAIRCNPPISGASPGIRAHEIQLRDDCSRSHIEVLAHQLFNLVIGDCSGAKCLNGHGRGFAPSNDVRELNLAPLSESGCDHVLGHVAGVVRAGAVDLRRVLSGESAAAVLVARAVGVDEDFAAVSPASAMGPPITKRPEELMWNLVSLSIRLCGTTSRMTNSLRSRRSASLLTSGSCWAASVMLSMRRTLPSSYSTVTWDFPSGLR